MTPERAIDALEYCLGKMEDRSGYNTLRDVIHALKNVPAELASLRKDKERLDWLDGFKSYDNTGVMLYWKICARRTTTNIRQAIDQAIDSMKGEME